MSTIRTAYDQLRREELIRLLTERDAAEVGGIRLAFRGQTPPWQIIRRVQPRRQRIEKKLCVASEAEQAENQIIEGENLQAMVSLYKYRGQVDLILTDPPYNTGQDFRYNDRWEEDPNDTNLGEFVLADDGSRHSKWLRFMAPRLYMMREMLKPTGVLAICIDHREVFRLGVLLDQIFDESNRLGIINWQKAHSPKNASTHLSSATEYILIYAKDRTRARTALLDRDEDMDKGFRNPMVTRSALGLGRTRRHPTTARLQHTRFSRPLQDSSTIPEGNTVLKARFPRRTPIGGISPSGRRSICLKLGA